LNSESGHSFAGSRRSLLTTIVLTVLADCVVIMIAKESALVPIKWFFGSVLSLILPGYSFIQAALARKRLSPIMTLCLVPNLSFLILALDGLAVVFLFGSLNVMFLLLFLSAEVFMFSIIAAVDFPKGS